MTNPQRGADGAPRADLRRNVQANRAWSSRDGVHAELHRPHDHLDDRAGHQGRSQVVRCTTRHSRRVGVRASLHDAWSADRAAGRALEPRQHHLHRDRDLVRVYGPCGVAQTFTQLLLYRAGVGVGEAGLSPAAHSLISDYFEAGRRASALAVYAFGIPLGAMIGSIAGGWIAQTFGWRWAFVLVGLPGVLVALAIKAYIKDPPRDYADRVVNPALPLPPPAPAFSLRRRSFASCSRWRRRCSASGRYFTS